MFRFIALFALTILLAACVSQVRSTYTPYHSLSSALNKKVIAVLPGNKEINESLRYEAYKQKINAHFEVAGLAVTDDPKNADYVAFVNYGIDAGTTTSHTGSMPTYGQTGGGTTTYHSGSVSSYGSSGYYSGSSYTMPTYGITGYQAYSYDQTTFKRFFAMDILDRTALDDNKEKKVYEVMLSSSGSCGNIDEVIDEMLEALFTEFPGVSGKPVRRDVETKAETC